VYETLKHLSPYRLTPEGLELVPPAFRGFLFGGAMHYYTFNIGDYRKDTGHLTTLEHGIYRQLLDWYYLDELPIPKETQTVIRRLRLVSDSDTQSLQNVLNDFFVLRDDGYHQSHCDGVIHKYHGMAKKNKANGKLGGRPKKTQSVILDNPDQSESKGNQEPITKNQQPTTKKEKKGASADVVLVDGLDVNAWTAWFFYRDGIGKPIKPASMLAAQKAMVKFGEQQSAVVEQSMANGWQGLFAIKQDTGKQSTSTTFAERDAATGRKRWEEMTGRKWPENETFIEADTFTLGIEHGTTD